MKTRQQSKFDVLTDASSLKTVRFSDSERITVSSAHSSLLTAIKTEPSSSSSASTVDTRVRPSESLMLLLNRIKSSPPADSVESAPKRLRDDFIEPQKEIPPPYSQRLADDPQREHLNDLLHLLLDTIGKPDLPELAFFGKGHYTTLELVNLLTENLKEVLESPQDDELIELRSIQLNLVGDLASNSVLRKTTDWSNKIRQVIDDYKSNGTADERAYVRVLRQSFRGVHILYDQLMIIRPDEQPKSVEDLISWVFNELQDIRRMLKSARLAGYVYTGSNNAHVISPNHNSNEKAPGSSKVANSSHLKKKPVPQQLNASSSKIHPKIMCNHCGGRHPTEECRRKFYPDTNPDPTIKWTKSKQGRAWLEQYGESYRPEGEETTLSNYNQMKDYFNKSKNQKKRKIAMKITNLVIITLWSHCLTVRSFIWFFVL
jgi:hypothetical protein